MVKRRIIHYQDTFWLGSCSAVLKKLSDKVFEQLRLLSRGRYEREQSHPGHAQAVSDIAAPGGTVTLAREPYQVVTKNRHLIEIEIRLFQQVFTESLCN
jgi:hypothetical protein